MAIEDFGLSADGYTAPRQADFLTAIRNQLDAELIALGYTELPDYERDTYLGNVTEIMAYMLGQLSESGQAVYDARSVANATGLQLGNLALIVGVTRDPATFSTVDLSCTANAGTTITQGKVVEGGGSDGKARWVITEDVTFATTGTLVVAARAEVEGSVSAIAGDITTIVTTVSGWTAVTNATATVGDDLETDSALRAKRQRALQASGSTSTNAILSALLNLDLVIGAVVLDNKTDATVVVDGVTIDPFAVAAIVAPNPLTSEEKALVVAAIYERLGAGTATSGAESGTVTKRDGRSETVNFGLATPSLVTVAWTLEMEAGFVVADVSDTLEAAVTDYFLTLAIGATVYPTPLIALAAAIDGVANVTTLLLLGGAAPVTHNGNELPLLSTHTVA